MMTVSEALRHRNTYGAGAKKRRKLKSSRDKFSTVMREFYRGTLHHGGSGKIVPANRPDIAKAIAASESGTSRNP